jgi:hypothetical protein
LLDIELKKMFELRKMTKTILIIDDIKRTHKEHSVIINQFHRSLLRIKDLISLARFNLKYMELKNQKDVDKIDEIVAHEVMVISE